MKKINNLSEAIGGEVQADVGIRSIGLEPIETASVQEDFSAHEEALLAQVETEKEKWIGCLSNFFRFCTKSNKTLIYFMMYEMYSRIGLRESLNVLIDVAKFNERKTIMLGTVYSLPFFSNFKLKNDDRLCFFSLINMLLEANNEMVDIELEEVLDAFVDDTTLSFLAECGQFSETNITKIQEMLSGD